MSHFVSDIMQSKSHVALRNIVEAHLEVSSDCNLRCKYCFAAGEDRERKLMSLDVAYEFIETVLHSCRSKEIRIVIHGGEPLLQSAHWLRNVLAYSYRLGRLLEKNIYFEMQSNLTLLDDEALEVINDYKVGVGTSLDGIPSKNDLSRGKGEDVMKGIKRLQNIGRFGGLICVVGKENCNNIPEVLDYFNNNGILACSLLIRYSVGRGSCLLPLSAEDIFSALDGSYQYLSATRGKAIIDRNVAGKLSRFLNPPTKEDFQDILVCDHPICGAGLTTCLCDTEGTLYPCGCAVSNSNNAAGMIDGPFDEMYIKKVTEFHYSHSLSQKKCEGCEALLICRCGCAAFGSLDHQTAESECHATKQFYRMLQQQPRSLIEEIIVNVEGNRPW